MTERCAYLTRLAALKLGREQIGFRDLEDFISQAAGDVGLLKAVFERAFEGRDPDTSNREFRVSFQERELISHAILESEESIDLVQQAFQLAHDQETARQQNTAKEPRKNARDSGGHK